MKKILLTISLCLSLFILSQAQQVYKGLGTDFSTFLLGNTDYAAKTQSLYLPGDFNNLVSGDITRIYYRYGADSIDQTLTRFSIAMYQTTQTTFSGNNFFTGFTPVFYRNSYTINGGAEGNWFAIDLDSPFTYDSTKTLIVQIIFPESAVGAWGTYGTSNTPVKKMMSPDTLATIGDPSSGTWQDFGFDVATTAGIQSFSNAKQFDFVVAPVPAKNQLTINLFNTFENNYQLKITNALGQSILEKQISKATENIDLTQYPNGIYFIDLKDDAGIIKSKKFVVEK